MTSNQSWRKVKLGIHNIITTQYGLTDDFGFDVDSMVKAIIEEEIKPLLAQQKREMVGKIQKEKLSKGSNQFYRKIIEHYNLALDQAIKIISEEKNETPD